MAGIIGAVGNNNKGVSGVAWSVKIMAVKSLDSQGAGSSDNLIAGIDYAIQWRANVINASWGGYNYSEAIREAIAAARNQGILFVAAAGNNGTLDDDIFLIYPACYDQDNIVAVAATTRTDALASYSHYGLTQVHLGAPGGEVVPGDTNHFDWSDGVYSTFNRSDSDYAYDAGTSMATPHVSGILALLCTYAPVDRYVQLKNRLLSSTDPLASLSGKCQTGGRANLKNVDSDERAWDEITGALGTIEYDERGTPGHDPFTAYARKIIKPVADRLGWDSKPDEAPGIQKLRRTLLRDLGEWGDAEVIAEARNRFAAFLIDRNAIHPDDQEMILAIVARNSDEATFKQLHEIAKSAHDETELRRFYISLMLMRDPKLAEQAVPIALADEIPAQAASLRLRLIVALTKWHPLLGWNAFTGNSDMLTKPFSGFAPQMIAHYVPLGFWNAVPLDQIEAWIKAHVPAEMAPEIARGMEAARFQVALKKALVPATDSYLQSTPDKSNPAAVE